MLIRKLRTAIRATQEKGPLFVLNIFLKKIFPSDNVLLSWESRALFRLAPSLHMAGHTAGPARQMPDAERQMVGINKQTAKGVAAAVARQEQCWVVEERGQVVAYVWIGARTNVISDTGYRIQTGSNPSYWWRDVYVEPEYRGKGLPGDLLSSWYCSLPAERRGDIYTEIAPHNAPSIKAHQRLGFEKIADLYTFCLLGARFFYVRRSVFPRFAFRFFPRNVYFTTIPE